MRLRELLLLIASAIMMLAASTLRAQYSAPPPAQGVYVLPTATQPLIPGSPIYRYGSMFSGIFYAGGNEFWGITDRGPNVDSGGGKVFLVPTFQPTIYHVRANANGTVTVLETIPITRPDGGPISGLPNPDPYYIGELAYDTLFAQVPFDDWGFDTEGIVRAPDGSFWVCDEYGPSITNIGADGRIAVRYRPQPSGGLPDILKRHVINRGFEGIARTPNGRIYAMVQSGLANSYANTASANTAAGNNTELLRVVELDPATGATRMFAYMMDAGYPTGGNNIRRRDIKMGDMVALNNDELLVIEHAQRGTGNAKRVYKISLAGATPITTEIYQPSPGVFKSLEELSRAEVTSVAGIVPVTKTLVLDFLNPGGGNPAWPVSFDKPEGLTVIDSRTITIGNDNDFGVISTNADGKVTLTGNPSDLFVYKLTTPLDYRLGAQGIFMQGSDSMMHGIDLFRNAHGCVGEYAMTLPITISNPSTRDLVITAADIYETDTTVTQGTPPYPLRRDQAGRLIPSTDYIITSQPGVAPLRANMPAVLPLTVPIGATRTLYVNFVAQRTGRRFARVMMRTNAQNFAALDTAGVDSVMGLLRFDLYGAGQGSRLSDQTNGRAPRTVTFPTVRIGESTVAPLVLFNPGDCVLRISLGQLELFSGDVDEFEIIGKPSSHVDRATNDLLLAPGAIDTVWLRFTPRQMGSRRAGLRLMTNDSTIQIPGITERGVYYIDLFGSGKADLYANDIDFGAALIGGTPADRIHRNVHVKNTLNGVVIITKIYIDGADVTEFAGETSPLWPKLPVILNGGDELDLGVIFGPQAGGFPGTRTATLKLITLNGDTINSHLSGIAGTRTISVTPGFVGFGTVSSARKVRRTITITNTGTMPLTLETPVLSAGSDFTLGSLPRMILAPGQIEYLELTYAPQGPGSSTATLTVGSNASTGPVQVNLNGTALKNRQTGIDPSQTVTGGVSYEGTWVGVPGAAGDASASGVTGEDELSGGMRLGDCVPNPARESAQITYTLGRAMETRLELFDAAGRLVAVMDAGMRDAGVQRITVDLRGFASGIYHYRLVGGGRSIDRTMLVVR